MLGFYVWQKMKSLHNLSSNQQSVLVLGICSIYSISISITYIWCICSKDFNPVEKVLTKHFQNYIFGFVILFYYDIV